MRILLPPSETKLTGGTGPALIELGFAATPLGRHRHRLTRAVARTASGRPSTAARAFGLPPAVAASAIEANRAVLHSPTLAALDRYQGTIYDALAAASFTPPQRTCADASVLIFSGLFGVAAADEAIPNYRVPAAAVLPRIGGVATSWRPILAVELPRLLAEHVAVDLRSTDYSALWRPAGTNALIRVRMLSRRPGGSLAVTSFFSKRGKGRLARALIVRAAAGDAVRTAADVAETWVHTGFGEVAVVGPSGVDLITAD